MGDRWYPVIPLEERFCVLLGLVLPCGSGDPVEERSCVLLRLSLPFGE
ncbi:MAG: hypothetical protein ABSB80_11595 [Methanoregula sp.]